MIILFVFSLLHLVISTVYLPSGNVLFEFQRDDSRLTNIHALKKAIELETGIPSSWLRLFDLEVGDELLARSMIPSKMTAVISCGDDGAMSRVFRAAAHEGNTSLLKLLLTATCDVQCLHHCHESPLHLAVKRGHEDAARLLIAHGADIHAREICGKEPLHLAAAFGRLNMMRMLLENRANVDSVDFSGRQPLHLVRIPLMCPLPKESSSPDYIECARLLLSMYENGEKAKAALDLAFGEEMNEIKEVLLKESETARKKL